MEFVRNLFCEDDAWYSVSVVYKLGGYFTHKFELDGHTGYMQLVDDAQRYIDVLTQGQAHRYKVRRSIKRT